jgi:membrane protein YdbS with pleckstrin-like domain
LEKDVREKIIKPPIKRVTSGKIFKPSKVFLRKNLLQPIVLVFTIWLIVVICLVGGSFIGAAVDAEEFPSAIQYITTWIGPVSFWTIVVNLVWLIPLLIYIPFEFWSIEYSVKAETGETMPEIYVKRGVVTVTRKHVPFRTITNISSKAGVFDRLFNIGSVHIETAGYSGSHQAGPEVKLEGIVFYEEVRDFILNELRKFKAPYVTGTEVVPRIEETAPRTAGLDDEILITLREIRDILKNQKTQK